MGLSWTGVWILYILILHHLAMFYVKSQAPVNLKTVFDIKTGNISVTWEDPPGDVTRGVFQLSYKSPSVPLTVITSITQNHYEFKPPVLGEVYTVGLFADRQRTRSTEVKTKITTPRSEYKTLGSTVLITLTGIDNDKIWEVWHDMHILLVIIEGTIVSDRLPGKTIAQVSPDNTQVVLTIQNVDIKDAGVYISKPRNSPLASESVLLVVTVKPSTPTITSSAAVVGLPATLHCQSQSNSVPGYHDLKLTYSWRMNDTNIAHDSRSVYTINNNNLTISTLYISNKYDNYVCIAAETNGLASSPASTRLELIYGPQTVTLNPSTTSIIVEEGKPIVAIQCKADCNPACALRWVNSKNRKNIFGSILNFGVAERSEENTYRCEAVAESPVPSSMQRLPSVAIRIDVQYKASITEASFSLNGESRSTFVDGHKIQINEHDNLALRCTVDADPLADVELLDKENNVLSTDEAPVLLKEFTEVACEQTGQYIFQASNSYNIASGSQARYALYVKVRCSPRELLDVPKVLGGKRNARILFTTTIIAYPTPTATWEPTVKHATIVKINDYTFNVSAFVDIIGEESYGIYNVIISNGVQSNLMLSFIVRAEDVFLNEEKGIDKTDVVTSLVVGICVSALLGLGGILLALVALLKLHKMKGKGTVTSTHSRRQINEDIPLNDQRSNAEVPEGSGSDYQVLDANMVAPPSIYDNKRFAGAGQRNSPIPTNESSVYDDIK